MNIFETYYNDLLKEEFQPTSIPPIDFSVYDQAKKQIIKVIELKKLSMKEGGFCTWQPKIKDFALQSPENMATTLLFPIATQMQNWGDVSKHFTDLMTHLRAKGNLKYADKEKENVKWKGMAYVGREGMEYIWKNRKNIYTQIKPLIDSDDTFELYKYCASRIPGLGLVKAAFAVQLLTGKLGCIDSVNARFLNIPPELLDKSGKMVSSVKQFVNKKSKQMSARGVYLLKLYVDFLKSARRYSNDDESRQLWDIWCSIIGIRTLTAGNKTTKYHFDAGSYKGEIPMYKATQPILQLQRRLIDAIKQNGGKMSISPDGSLNIDNKAIAIASNLISQDHFKLPLSAMQIPQERIISLNSQYLKGNQPNLFEGALKTAPTPLEELKNYIIKILKFKVKRVNI